MNPTERSLDDLADISMSIMKKAVNTGALTQTDILLLTLYKKEKARASSVPTYRKIIGGVKEVVGAIKLLLPGENADITAASGTEADNEL